MRTFIFANFSTCSAEIISETFLEENQEAAYKTKINLYDFPISIHHSCDWKTWIIEPLEIEPMENLNICLLSPSDIISFLGYIGVARGGTI